MFLNAADKKLITGVKNRDIPLVMQALKDGAQVDVQKGKAVRIAAKNALPDIVDILIKAGAAVNGYNKKTPLQLLLNQKITPENNHDIIATAKALILAGATIDEKSMRYAINNGEQEIVKMMLDAGIDPNMPCDWMTSNFFGYAIYNGEYEIAEVLLNAGTSDYFRHNNSDGVGASIHRNLRSFDSYLYMKNRPTALTPDEKKDGVQDGPSRWEYTLKALIEYAAQGNMRIINRHISRGRNLDLQDNEGQSIINSAAENGERLTVEALIQAGADTSVLSAKHKKQYAHLIGIESDAPLDSIVNGHTVSRKTGYLEGLGDIRSIFNFRSKTVTTMIGGYIGPKIYFADLRNDAEFKEVRDAFSILAKSRRMEADIEAPDFRAPKSTHPLNIFSRSK